MRSTYAEVLKIAVLATLSCRCSQDGTPTTITPTRDARADAQSDAGARPDARVDGSAEAAPADTGTNRDVLEAGPPGKRRTRWDWNGIVGTGQSLAVGGWGSHYQAADLFIVSTTQPYGNLKLHDSTPFDSDGGQVPYALSGGGVYSVVPLVEPFRGEEVSGVTTDFQYPTNIWGETPQSGMANELTFLAIEQGEPGVVSLHSAVGWWGHDMTGIDKSGTGRAYPASLMEARAFKALADRAGKSFGYEAVVLTHGESDATNANYGTELERLWLDYDQDLSAITGQKQRILLMTSQQSTSPFVGVPLSSLAMWRAGVEHEGGIVCTGPKYQYTYVDGVHLDAASYRRLGEKYAEVLDAIDRGVDWKPLQPIDATLAGKAITVTFHVPTPPLAWDDTLPLPHTSPPAAGIADNRQWANGRGFEVADASGPITIDAVDISGNSVVLTLPSVPSRDGLVVRYAITQDANVAAGGSATGRMGLLRDSNDVVGYDAIDVDVNVSNGSNVLTAVTPSAFRGRTTREIVTHASLPPNTVIVSRTDPNTVALSNPWTGGNGTATVRLHNSLHNYAVHFELDVK